MALPDDVKTEFIEDLLQKVPVRHDHLIDVNQPEPEPGSLGEFAETIIDKDGELEPEVFDEPAEGNYRGPVEGQAQVQWLRQGQRYQVHLDVSIGPFFAPLVSRRMTSDGALSDQGLVPLRYDEETQVAWRTPRRRQLSFTETRVRLAEPHVTHAQRPHLLRIVARAGDAHLVPGRGRRPDHREQRQQVPEPGRTREKKPHPSSPSAH